MHTHRGKYVFMSSGGFKHITKMFQVDTHAQHMPYAMLARIIKRTFKLALKGRQIESIKMTM
jgi:hypothetical protein